RYGYSVRHFSYDLLHPLGLFNTPYPPAGWAWDFDQQKIWLAYSQYRSAGRLNLQTGNQDFYIFDPLRRPVDIAFIPNSRTTYILDQQKQNIYKFQQQALIDSFPLPDGSATRIATDLNFHIWVLDTSRILQFSANGSAAFPIEFSEGFKGQDLYIRQNRVYALAVNINSRRSEIIRQDVNSANTVRDIYDGLFTVVRESRTAAAFWVGEYIDPNTSRCVKLSFNGERLLVLGNFISVDDIQINDNDTSIVVVDRSGNEVSLWDPQGHRISAARPYDPIKVVLR
ncbi:MAG: hypothetical protein WAN36_05855, partial [Calditrichia bacterium]